MLFIEIGASCNALDFEIIGFKLVF